MSKKQKVKGKPITSYVKLIQPEPVPTEIKLVIPAKEKPGVLKALGDIRSLFGKNGQNWIQGQEHEHYEPGEEHPDTGKTLRTAFDGYCLIGGVYAVDGRYEQAARGAIALAIAEREELALSDPEYGDDVVDAHDRITNDVEIITTFNDENADWPAIKAVLARAKVLVKTAATE